MRPILTACLFSFLFGFWTNVEVKAYKFKLASIKFVDIYPGQGAKDKEASPNDYDIHEKIEIHGNKSKKSKDKAKKMKVKVSSDQRVGPMTLKVKMNPFNRNRSQASLNLDVVESYDILTHKKRFTCDLISWEKIKQLKAYVSRDNINEVIATVKAELKPEE